MANSFTAPTSGSGLIPSPDAVVSGQIIQADTISRLGNMLNYAHAQLGCSPVVSQGWPDGVFSVIGTPAAPNARWRIPIPSNAHSTLLIHVKADNSSNAGSITLEELTNNNTSTINLTSTSRWYEGTLSVGAQAGTYLEITATADATAGTTTISYLSLQWQPLSSPLAAGVVDSKHSSSDITPMGANRSAADYPLSSARGVALLNSLKELAKRPRVFFAWSGLQNAAPITAPKSMLPSDFQTKSALSRKWGGSRAREHEYEAHIYAATHGNGDDREIIWRDQRATIPAAQIAPAWQTLTTDEPERVNERPPAADLELLRDGPTLPRESALRAPASPIWSMVVWGP